MATFNCPFCDFYIACDLKVFHVVNCLHEFCDKNKIPCLLCSGAQPKPAPQPNNHNCDGVNCNNNNHNHAPPATGASGASGAPSQPLPNPDKVKKWCACNPEQLQGRVCFFCGKRKEKKLPGKLGVGHWIEDLRVCQKGEMCETVMRKHFEAAIDKLADNIRVNGDLPPIGFDPDNSDSDTDNEKEDAPLVGCDGYRDSHGRTCTSDHFKPIIHYTTQDGVKKNFCKASHLTRYLIRHYTSLSKGKSPAKRRRDDEDEDEADLPPNTTTSSSSSSSSSSSASSSSTPTRAPSQRPRRNTTPRDV